MYKYRYGYSEYSPNEFNNKDYLNVGDLLLKYAPSDESKRRIQGILKDGGYDNYSVNENADLMNHNSPIKEEKKRIGMAWLISRYPQTFDTIRENDIAFFHGTNSNALPYILKNGLNSLDKIKKDGGVVLTGETWSMKYRLGQQSGNFVSVTDDIDTAGDYSTYGTSNGAAYSVLLGIKKSALSKLRTRTIHSDCVEMGIVDGIPPELISFIGVPEDKINDVKKMILQNSKIDMTSVDVNGIIEQYRDINVKPVDFNERFYYIDEAGVISYSAEKAEQMYRGEKEPRKAFGIEQFRKLSLTRVLGRLLESMKNLKHQRRKDNEIEM